MGTEYRIFVDEGHPLDRDRLEAFLRRLPHFARVEPSFATYDFQHPTNPGPLPNVSLKIESEGSLYVCDHGGGSLSRDLIGALIVYLVHEGSSAVRLVLVE